MATGFVGSDAHRTVSTSRPLDAEPGSNDDAHLTAVSNQNSNANIISGTVQTLINYNPATTYILYGGMPQASDATQMKISTILEPRHVPQAVYGAQIGSGCMEGTRVQVLRDIAAWIKDLKGHQIFWLAGMAGTGKSAIAWTICARANDDPEIILGGSFFCSRSTGLTAQRDVRCVVPTLAQQMARQSTVFSQALAAELVRDPDVLHQQVRVQVEKLLCKPLLALKDSIIPIVFVIDALDECGGQLNGKGALDDAETHRIVSDMLEALVAFSRSSARLPVKFLVTSRPETHIRDTHVSDTAFSKILRLHTVEKQQVGADIKLYISSRLLGTSTLRTLFAEDDVFTLVKFCDGLFLVAATALDHALGSGIDVAAARFKSLLNASRDRLNSGAAAPLDRIYATIVEDAAKADEVETDKLKNLRRILAALLSARMTLSVAALADLLNLPRGQLRASISRLHAVIQVPEDDDDSSLRPVHASFGDYLLGRASSRIRIPESLGHDTLTHGSFHLLSKGLHFNVSRSASSFNPNSPVQRNGISRALEYSCLQWIYHVSSLLESSTTEPNITAVLRSRVRSLIHRRPRFSRQTELDEKINQIFRPRLLFWLEVMSILSQVQRAAAMLIFATATVRSKDLSRFLRDANSFVASSHPAIERSASHIYLSALPLADPDSLVYQQFATLCTGLIAVDLTGISHHGGRLVMTLSGHESAVHSVSYSPDGPFLASGSADGTVRIWDTRTGEEIMSPLHSGDGAVLSVFFAPHGQNIVSGTEGSPVCFWSLGAAQAIPRKLRGHSSSVSAVTVAPNGSHIASASLDKTVRLWNVETKQQLAVLRIHAGSVRALCFAADSRTLAFGSEDQAIQLWDIVAGKAKYPVQHRQNKPIYSVCFFPDGHKIAVGSGHDILLCNAQTGKPTAQLYSGPEPISSVDVSSDGLSLVAAHGKSVCFSTLTRFRTKSTAILLDGHTDVVRSATFSSDGLYIASASDDGTVRMWNASRKLDVLPSVAQDETNYVATVSSLIMSDCRKLTGHAWIRSVVVTPNGAGIVSGSSDGSARVFDVNTGALMFLPLLGHTDWVYSVAISSNGRLIASGSADKTVRLWDARTGKVIGEPMQGHTARVSAVGFSPDAQWLVSGSHDNTVRVWDVETRRLSNIGILSCEAGVNTIAFSPDGRLIAAGDENGYINIWQSGTGQPVEEPLQSCTLNVYCICFSPDGKRIASGGHRGHYGVEPVCISDVSTGQRLLTLTGHTGSVLSVSYSPDSRIIVIGSEDHTVRLWDAVEGTAIAILRGHTDPVTSVAFTPDGRSIVSGSNDKTIRVWNIAQASKAHFRSHDDAVAALDSAILHDGWLRGPSGELLLWVPSEYRQYLYRPRGSLRRVVMSVSPNGWHRGESWTSCWRSSPSDATFATI